MQFVYVRPETVPSFFPCSSRVSVYAPVLKAAGARCSSAVWFAIVVSPTLSSQPLGFQAHTTVASFYHGQLLGA